MAMKQAFVMVGSIHYFETKVPEGCGPEHTFTLPGIPGEVPCALAEGIGGQPSNIWIPTSEWSAPPNLEAMIAEAIDGGAKFHPRNKT